jgi:hypothetical protein
MKTKWAILFYIVPRSPDNDTKLDRRAERVRDEIVRLARKYPDDLRVAYRLAPSGPDPATRVVIGKTPDKDKTMTEADTYLPGEPAPLPQFLRWAHKNGCKGKRCAVFFWGHGFGPAGLFSLEDLQEFRAVAKTAVPIEVPQLKSPANIKTVLPQPANVASATPLTMAVPRSSSGRVATDAREPVAIASAMPLTMAVPHSSSGRVATSAREPVAIIRTAVPIAAGVHVQIGSRFATIRRSDGRQLKLRPDALFTKNNQIFIYTPPQLIEAKPTQPVLSTKASYSALTTAPNLEKGLKALQKVRKRPIDIVFFQTCWASGLEFAHQMKGDARAMVASQTLVPIQMEPWPYAQLFAKLRKASKLDGPSLKRLVRSLVRTLGTWHNTQQQRRPITGLSLKDKSVTKAFERVVKLLKTHATRGPLELEYLYSNAPKKDRKNGLYKTENTGLIDVLRLCDHFAAHNGDRSVVSAARKLAKLLKKKLILGHHTPDKELYRGVTVYYHPSQDTIDRLNLATYVDNAHIEWLMEPQYEELSFAHESKWTPFAFENQQ